MDKLRFGFVGAGMIAYSSAKSVSAHERAEVVAAQDLNPERLKALCEERGIARPYSTAKELIEDPEIDAVYIAVPNKFHAELAIQALQAGKHVLLEKPFAMSADEAESVIAAAEKAGKAFTLGMNQRFREDSQKIKALAKQGVFGEIYHGKAYWIRRQGIPKLGTWFGNKALAGAGAINDIGVHLLDLCLHIMDNFEPVSVSGQTYTKFGNRGLGEGRWGLSDPSKDIVFDVDDFASAFIKFKNGATVTLDVTWACHTSEANRNNVDIFGTEAGASTYPAKVYRADPIRSDYDVIENVRADIAYPHCDRFHNFINHILDGEELSVKPSQALAIQRILDGVQESAATGREVRLDA